MNGKLTGNLDEILNGWDDIKAADDFETPLPTLKRSPDQEAAWKHFLKWVAAGKSQEFKLGGLAGTGKTTLIRSMRDQMNSCEVIAPTAKAAEVLNRKGVPAMTCHSLLCRFENETVSIDGRTVPVFSDKKISRDFLIVDEASMITGEMRDKILRCAKRVVWVGDYGQLPPVEPDGNGTKVLTEESLDAKLTEQHRHGDALEIIRFANFLRAGGNPKKWVNASSQVSVNPPGITSMKQFIDHVLSNQIWPVICYPNAFISTFNKGVREVSGFDQQIEVGLKIVCNFNNQNYGIANGEMFTVASFKGNRIRTECGKTFPITFDPKGRGDVRVQDGYAVTCHKSQGSEWPSIAVIEERTASPEWRYTAATRAQKSVVYLTNDEA